MGCATKNAKVVAISLGSLQRLIALKAVPQSAVPLIITTMTDCMNQGVDIQLRILQTLLSLITNFPAVHGQLLGDVSSHGAISLLNLSEVSLRGPPLVFQVTGISHRSLFVNGCCDVAATCDVRGGQGGRRRSSG